MNSTKLTKRKTYFENGDILSRIKKLVTQKRTDYASYHL